MRTESAIFGRAAGGGIVSIAVIRAVQFGAMGAVSALRETNVVFAALIGRMLLSEPLNFQRIASCVVIALGAMCLGA
ncbi:multidrug DMT transporter permease [Caballeronia arationis]|uniref:hypothetical protein n=1 Tax=Caballeronia arationis TaxID=1777142 RepID=UPI00074B5911|nr:multidrug DMT transporter permease [Caballeronia arationis]